MPSKKNKKKGSNKQDADQEEQRDQVENQTQGEEIPQKQSQEIAQNQDHHNHEEPQEKSEVKDDEIKQIESITPSDQVQQPGHEHHKENEQQPAQHDSSSVVINEESSTQFKEDHTSETQHVQHEEEKPIETLPREHEEHKQVSQEEDHSAPKEDDASKHSGEQEVSDEPKEVHHLDLEQEQKQAEQEHTQPLNGGSVEPQVIETAETVHPEEVKNVSHRDHEEHHNPVEKVDPAEHVQQKKDEKNTSNEERNEQPQSIEHTDHKVQDEVSKHTDPVEPVDQAVHKEINEDVQIKQNTQPEHNQEHAQRESQFVNSGEQNREEHDLSHHQEKIQLSEASILNNLSQPSSSEQHQQNRDSTPVDYNQTLVLGEKHLNQSEFDIINSHSERKNPSRFDQQSEDVSEKGVQDRPQQFDSLQASPDTQKLDDQAVIQEEQKEHETPQPSTQPPELDIKAHNMKRFQAILDEAAMLKNLGNQCVKDQSYKQAINNYADALRLCHPVYLMECPGELIESFRVLNVSIMNNLSFCYLNIGDYNDCITFASQVLQVESRNSKAMYRIAQAYEKKDDLEEALKFITQAKQISPEDAAIQERFNIIRRAYNSQKDAIKTKQREVFGRMFKEKPEKNESENQSDKKLQRDSSVISNQDQTIQNTSQKKQQPQAQTQSENGVLVSQAVLSTAVTALLTTFVQRQLFKEKHITPYGIASAGLLGSGVFGMVISKKLWLKLAFGAASSGAMAFLIFLKMGRN